MRARRSVKTNSAPPDGALRAVSAPPASLAIDDEIASDAGGALTARNAPSGGALFVLTLRRARTHHPDSVSEPAGSH
ncbi:hypothetical protein QM277_19895 [Acinetobacter baumannii]|uniref:hypothetical protein n=1 Tax=Acinetobacter baumannii TaxID=470 RepID=UPI0024B7517A|nr:hypothetical protein [Acinetobacter baumannii]MDI9705516.1 hypothetical protein [Acinetobacter baumannii]